MNMMASHSRTFGALSATDGADTAARAWTALHAAAAVAFILADGRAPPLPDAGALGGGDVGARFAASSPERRAAVSRGLDDLAIMLEAALGALLAASEQGGAIGPAAAMLSEEFLAARGAVLALLGPQAVPGA